MYTHEYTESFCSPVGGPSQSDMAGDWGGPGQSSPASWLSAHRWSVLCFALSDSHTLLFVSLYPSFFQQTVQWPVGMSIRRSHTSPLDTKFVTSCPVLDPVVTDMVSLSFCDCEEKKSKNNEFLSFPGAETDNVRSFLPFLARWVFSETSIYEGQELCLPQGGACV